MICIWSSWCQCHPVISCFIKIQNGLPFWYRITQVVLKKRPLNGCSSTCYCINSAFLAEGLFLWLFHRSGQFQAFTQDVSVCIGHSDYQRCIVKIYWINLCLYYIKSSQKFLMYPVQCKLVVWHDLVSSATASASVLSGSSAFCTYFGASAVMPGIPDSVICTRITTQ